MSSESARFLFPVPIAGEFPIPLKFPARYSRTMTAKQIKAGKRYLTAGGDEVRIYATDGGEPQPVHGAMKGDHGWEADTWTADGSYLETTGSRYDIEREVPRAR